MQEALSNATQDVIHHLKNCMSTREENGFKFNAYEYGV